MMRRFFLFLSERKGIRRWMETSRVWRNFTRRFVAGDTLEDGLRVVASLEKQKIFATLDHLGEKGATLDAAAASRDSYLEALSGIAARRLPATVSIKLTQFGLELSEEACLENVRQLAARAKAMGSGVEIDMESSAYAEPTLRITAKVAEEFGCVRSVIQAYLYRSAGDIERLNRLSIPVRLVKGAYEEAPQIAFAQKTQVDRNYVTLMKTLLERGTDPAIATHDEQILGEAFRYARELKLAPEKFEFQMLYGIRRDLQRRVVDLGYRLRLYVPYGTEWYPYFMRRLAERPANVFFLLRNLLR